MLVLIILQSFLPAIDVFARSAGEDLFSQPGRVAPQEDSTATPTPQDQATATPTETPFASETLVETETVVPTATPQPPTAEASLTPIPSPTGGADLDGEQYQILLETDPEFISPGGQVNLQWQLIGKNLEGLDLVFWLPSDVSLKADKKQAQEAEEPTEIYRIPAEEKGSLHFDVSAEAEMPVIVEVFLLPQFLEKNSETDLQQLLAENYIALLESNSVNMRGGKAEGLKGKVKVDFPDGALDQDVTVFINNPLPESMPPFSLSGNPFEINAYPLKDKSGDALRAFTADRENKGKEINKFNQEVEIEVAYDESLYPNTEQDLVIYWYDEETGQWEPLFSHVNTDENVIRAVTNHFTVFDINVNSWQASRLPTVDSFQVSGFTGAGTFHFPIEAPPGPGGLQPSISLDYNSQVVDSASIVSQASWVGMGWSLDVGTIERNSNGTPTWTGDDSFFLSFNGVSSTIVNVGGVYRLSDENFWKIEKLSNPDRWEIKDKIGNTYVFGYVTHFWYPHEEWDKGNLVACHTDSMPIRWSLQQVRNIHGQAINYSYSDETKTIQRMHEGKDRYDRTVCKPNEASTINAATATYVSTIAYGGYRVRFEREARDDYTASKQTNPYYYAFERSRLKTIYIENQTGSSYTVVRKYVLGYETDPAKMVFPGVVWTMGGRNATLTSIQEVNPAGTKAISSYSFLYGDNRHLTLASNMHGASVKFDYEPWGVPDENYAGYAADHHVLAKTFNAKFDLPYHRHPDVTYGSVYYEDNTLTADRLVVSSTVAISAAGLPENLVVPGGLYRLSASVATSNPNARIRMGIQSNTSGIKQDYFDGPSGVKRLPADATALGILIDTTGYVYQVGSVKIELLTAGYRVAKKTVTTNAIVGAEDAHSYTTSYAYFGEDVNRRGINTSENLLCPDTDPYYPPENPTCYEYVPEYSEFRGHSLVIEKIEPDGPITETYYYQDHLRKGRIAQVVVKADPNKILKWSFFAYQLPEIPDVVQQPFFEGCHVGVCSYTGLYHAWVPMKAQQNRTYASAQTYTATREEYKYDNYGNQIEALNQYQYGEGTPWISHIRTETQYFPKDANGVYLVGLPGKVKPYDTKGTIETGDDIPLGVTLYLYDDNQGGYTQPPSRGKLTAVRTKINDPDLYSQISYGYDEWGNRTSETTWSDFGTVVTSPPTTGGRTTTTLFDSIYHTYPVSVRNPLNQTVAWTYDYSLGVPVSETDPNGAVTNAFYDDFGRLVKLIRPGDDSANPTLLVSYSNRAPFETTIRQRLDGNRYFAIRRVYDGMGRQVFQQSGTGRASGALTIFNTVDTMYVSVNETRQSAPYGSNEAPAYTISLADPAARSTTVTAPDGSQTISMTNGLITTVTDPAGRETISRADAWGRVVKVEPPTGPTVGYVYSKTGQLTKAIRAVNSVVEACLANPDQNCPESSTVSLLYDMAGRKIAMSDPDMGDWTYTYDALGNLTGQTDARGCTLTLTYDLLNRLKSKTSSGSCGETAAIIGTAGENVIYTYDLGANGIGRRTAMQDASTGSGSTTWAYDARGRMTTENKAIDGQTYTTQWTYNSADLPEKMIYPDDEEVTNYYTPQMMLDYVVGNSTYVFDTTYDSAGRMTQRSLGGELIPVDPPAPTAPIFSDVAVNHWARDIFEGLYALGVVGHCATSPLRFCLDNPVTRASIAIDILRAKYGGAYLPPDPTSPTPRFSDVPASHSAYAWIDKFAEDGISAGCGSGNFCPDSQVLRIQMIIFLLRAKYDGIDEDTPYTPPPVPENGHIFTDMENNPFEAWAVDAYNKGITTGCGNGKFCPNDPVNRATEAILIEQTFKIIPGLPEPETVLAPVVEQNYDYYAWDAQGGRLAQLMTTAPGTQSTTLQNLSYQYDTVGNIGAIVDAVNNETQAFGYDALDRLTDWTLNNTLQERYTYSANGNLLSKGAPTQSQFTAVQLGKYTLQYDSDHPHAADTLVDSVKGDVVNSYSYDENGNQQTRSIANDGSYTLLYDAENRLVKVEKDRVTIAEFTYDGDGRQVKSVIDGVTTLYVGAHYEIKNPGSGQQEITKYYFAGASRVAVRRYTIPVSSTLEFILGDHLGSTSLTVDKNGEKTSAMRYKPWGEVRPETAYVKQDASITPSYRLSDYTFTGQRSYMDDPTTTGATEGFGLMFYNARWYDPQLGRFAQADTIVPGGAQGLDRYAYVRNNPLKYTDPTGHREYCDEEKGGRCPSEGKDYPTPVHRYLLDNIPGTTGIDGQDVYSWYLDLFNNKYDENNNLNWWWDDFGEDADGFTIWDAFAVIYVHETQGNWTDPNLPEAAIRDANTWCGGNCTTEGYINHFAHEYESAGNYFGSNPSPPGYKSWGAAALAGMQKLAKSFSNHPNDWNTGCSWLAPCGWANKSMYSRQQQDVLAANQASVFTYYDPSGNTWIIPSQCVYVRWMHGGYDLAYNLSASCPSVR